MSQERDATGAASAARGETPAAFGPRCIPAPPHGAQSAPWGPRADCVAPPSNMANILSRRALSAGRLAGLDATLDFHHGLLKASYKMPQPPVVRPTEFPYNRCAMNPSPRRW